MKRRFSYDSFKKMNWAIDANDIATVKSLLENNEVYITNVFFAHAVMLNRIEIVKYFLDITNEAISVISYGLAVAVRNKNEKLLVLIVEALRDNKSKYVYDDVDSVIASEINHVGELGKGHDFSSEETIRYASLITATYTKNCN